MIGPDAFILARRADRAARVEQRLRRKADALSALHQARDAFREQVGGGAEADSDRLELVADRVMEWVAALERDLERLDPARDHAVWRGAILTRARTALDPADLAASLAETIAEAALSAAAGAVLVAAVRHASI